MEGSVGSETRQRRERDKRDSLLNEYVAAHVVADFLFAFFPGGNPVASLRASTTRAMKEKQPKPRTRTTSVDV